MRHKRNPCTYIKSEKLHHTYSLPLLVCKAHKSCRNRETAHFTHLHVEFQYCKLRVGQGDATSVQGSTATTGNTETAEIEHAQYGHTRQHKYTVRPAILSDNIFYRACSGLPPSMWYRASPIHCMEDSERDDVVSHILFLTISRALTGVRIAPLCVHGDPRRMALCHGMGIPWPQIAPHHPAPKGC